jgi:hypothetical protein
LAIGQQPQPEGSSHAISLQPLLTHDLGGRPAREATQPKDLGQAILAVNQSKSPPGIVVVERFDVGNPPSIAEDTDRGGEPRHRQAARFGRKSVAGPLHRLGRTAADPDQQTQYRQGREPLPRIP